MSLELFHPGLKGIVAGETEISCLDDGLTYRGYCIHDLVEQASFLEVAWLLLFEDLPSAEELADFRSILIEEARVPDAVHEVFEQLPIHTSATQALRTGISLLSHFDPQPSDGIVDAAPMTAARLMSRLPLLVGLWHRLRRGEAVLEFDPDLGVAANIYYVVTGRQPSVLHEHALQTALIVSAEQEFNPATYAARVVASTQADLYAAALAGLSAAMGTSSGTGNEEILDVLGQVGRPDRAGDWLAAQDDHYRVPGFGHPVYQQCDPRAAILERVCSELAEASGQQETEELAEAIETAVWQHRRLPANLDWPLARLYSYLEFPPELHLPLFACSRVVGWCAHAIEQARDGDVIRPRARYRGAENLTFVPLHERG